MVTIDKDKFNRLKQLDRIEFRQRYSKIKELLNENNMYWVVLMILVLGCFLFISNIWLMIRFGETLDYWIIKGYIIFSLILGFVSLVLDLINCFRYVHYENKLINEFGVKK